MLARRAWCVCALVTLGCSGPSEIVVVVGVAEAPPGWVDTVRITVDGNRTFDTPVTDGLRLPLTLGVTSDGAADLNVVAEALHDGETIARQEGQMGFLPGQRLLLHLYLSPECAESACDEELTCHLDGCIDVRREACPFEGLPDNGPDLACLAPVGMDGGVPDGGDRRDADVSDGGDAGDAGPVECTSSMDCDDGNPCTASRCVSGACAFDAVADETSCDDGMYCDGVDRCLSGVCNHPGDPCPAMTFCDETLDTCAECRGNSDCPAPTTTERWQCCTGTCVDLSSSATSCGGCGTVCPSTICAGGYCDCEFAVCPLGQNCAPEKMLCECGNGSQCASGQRCDGGACVYP